MRTRWRWGVGLVGLMWVGCVSTSDVARFGCQETGLRQLAWLVGAWISNDGERISEEHWTRVAGGTMFGINRTIVDGQTVAFEYLRIEQTPQGIVYLASPNGRYPPTSFRLVQLDGQRVVFENPVHDFPKRIIYWREADTLWARIEGEKDGEMKSSQWSWQHSQPGQ